MAMLISRATGNFTSASTWGVADSATGSQLTNPSASTNTTTSYVYSSTFTGTNTSVSDGIALFLKRLTTTGTVTVALSDDNGVTATRSVTVNASDLPADESWVFFKFGSTLTLDGGTDYRVGVIASSADNALIYRNATAGNWARMVSTTTTGAPAAGDTMLIVGEWTGAGASSSYTVTMDNTAVTDFGLGSTTGTPTQTNPQTYSGIQIGQNGNMTWGTSAATNYYLRLSGNLIVWSGGTYNMGTSGTPCPRDSTMIILFDSTGTTATTTYGFCGFNGATISVYGQSRTAGKNIISCKLSANASANATSLTVDTDTGWLDNDEIAVASTTQTRGECEIGALNGNAGASTLTVDGFAGTAGGLAFAHGGSNPIQAEVINLSRNVAMRGNSTTQTTFFRLTNVSSCTFSWCRFNFINSTIIISTATSTTALITFEYCAFSYQGGEIQFSSQMTFNYNCAWCANVSNNIWTFSSNASTITNNILLYTNQTGFTCTLTSGGAFSGNTAVGCGTNGMGVILASSVTNITITDCVAHSNNNGFSVGAAVSNVNIVLENAKVWRNIGSGLFLNAGAFTVTNGLFFGSVNAGVVFSANNPFATFSNCTIASDTTFTQASGVTVNLAGATATFNNCSLSPTSGIYTANTTDFTINGRAQITLNNTLVGAATEVTNPSTLGVGGFIKSSKHDQTEGAFKSWFGGGIVERDTTIYNTAAPSERLTPSSATIKLASGSRLVAVNDLATVTINAYVRKSTAGDGAAYNGNQPRLILKANLACGINADVVLDTMTVGTGTWEQLTGTTAAVDADGALEFYVDCDGTAGWVNVDDWTVT